MSLNVQKKLLIAFSSLLGLIGVMLWNSTSSGTHTITNKTESKELMPDIDAVVNTTVTQDSFVPFTASDLPNTLSLKTDIAGEFKVDAQGHFVPTIEAIDLIEYFWSTQGKLTTSEILDLLTRYTQTNLAEPATSEALAFISTYLQYRKALDSVISNNNPTNDHLDPKFLSRQLQATKALRVQYFGPQLANTLFKDSLDYDTFTIARLQAIEDSGDISDTDAKALAAKMLSTEEQRVRNQTTAVIDYSSKAAALTTQENAKQKIAKLRAETFGVESVERFEALDRQNDLWKSRVQEYLTKLKQLKAQKGLSESYINESTIALQSSFSASERLRLKAFESNPELLD